MKAHIIKDETMNIKSDFHIIPTIILHGTEDPVLPFAHGEALQKTIHNAKLIPLSGVGHELPAEIWKKVINAIYKNT